MSFDFSLYLSRPPQIAFWVYITILSRQCDKHLTKQEKNIEKASYILLFGQSFDIMIILQVYYSTKCRKEKEMFENLLNFLQKKKIDLVGALPLSACRIIRPYLLEHANISSGTVFMLAVPYFTPACEEENRCISAYAVARDYHLFFEELFEELLLYLKNLYPTAHFAAFSDHSPISELHAAARAGLGTIGKNGLLLTEKYGSYVFLGELVTDIEVACEVHPVRLCRDCGACSAACPSVVSEKNLCLSALSQKKGELSGEERELLRSTNTVWGCDRCQEVCPYNKRAKDAGSIYSPIPFFHQDTLACPGVEDIENMSNDAFASRAYSWRGRDTILRNLRLLEKGDSPC